MYLVHTTNCNQTSISNALLFNLPSQDAPNKPVKPKTIQDIFNGVCELRNVTKEQVYSKSRKREVCITRQIIAYLVKTDENIKMTLKAIANELNLRDHTAVIYSANTMQDLVDTDKIMKAHVAAIRRIIYAA